VIVCAQARDAQRLMAVLPQRFGRYGLRLHPAKTRLVPFQRPPWRATGARHHHATWPGTFAFLGFVRHEVAYTAVMTQKGGHNLVCCHQYPTQTCGWSNLAV
jgi:hypothetical protein